MRMRRFAIALFTVVLTAVALPAFANDRLDRWRDRLQSHYGAHVGGHHFGRDNRHVGLDDRHDRRGRGPSYEWRKEHWRDNRHVSGGNHHERRGRGPSYNYGQRYEYYQSYRHYDGYRRSNWNLGTAAAVVGGIAIGSALATAPYPYPTEAYAFPPCTYAWVWDWDSSKYDLICY